jgi:hypothetical protein
LWGEIIRKEKRYKLIIRRKKDVRGGAKIIHLKKIGPKCK